MQSAVKKMYISILVLVLVLFTGVATTYAWVGILTHSNFEEFEVNIKSSNLREYGLELSLDGVNFTTEIETIDIEKQILLNFGYTDAQLSTDEQVERLFSSFRMDQCTVKPNFENNTLSEFTTMKGSVTKRIFKFDLYISAFKVYETAITTDYKVDAFLHGDILQGTVGSYQLFNEFTYPSNFINNTGNVTPGTTISKMSVDSSYACRVAFQKYEVVEKYKPELYTEGSQINDLIIYQGGTQDPMHYPDNNVYSFGGILETPYNLAMAEHNYYSNTNVQVPDWAIERGKKELEVNPQNSQLVDSTNVDEQIGVDEMMKMTIYMWFEGWDSDCYFAIDRKPVTLNLNFSNYGEII